MARFRKSSTTHTHHFDGDCRFEDLYRDNTVYFITARCRDKYHAFASEEAKAAFWDRYAYYTKLHGFVPTVTSLMVNHYLGLGYLRKGKDLGHIMCKLHGSVAKLVNDLLPERRVPFWREAGHQDYFDGCIRDEFQCRRAFRYAFTEGQRHHVCTDPAQYPHTRVNVDLERAVRRALELGAFMEGVPYKRYERNRRRK